MGSRSTLLPGSIGGGLAPFLAMMLALTGCGTTAYTPAPSPRIATTPSGYVRDGREYTYGLFGGGALDLVRGNPRAEALVQRSRRKVLAGFAFGLVGFAGIPASAQIPNTGLAISAIAASTVLSVGSILYFGDRSYADFLDAINVYNDDLLDRERACTPTISRGAP